jgi:DNA-binding NtrC family response regulator
LATDGEAALKMSRNHSGHIDLLLTDVIMPTMSGPTLAQKLLAQRPHTQVLFMSGMTNAAAIPPDLRQRSTFIEKHPPLDGLVQTVQNLLETH